MATTRAILGVGVIGCGNISTTYFSFASLFRGYRMVACADINPDAAAAAAAEYGIQALSVEALLQHNDIDVVINLTIPEVHAAVSLSVLEAGKHVYSEKPLAIDLASAREMKNLADAKGLLIGCAPDTWLGGSHQQARRLIDEGLIGTVTSGTCHVMSPGMESWHPAPDFFYREGGGPVLDLGPYYLSNLVNLIGPVKRVTAMGGIVSETRIIGNGDREGERIPVTTPTTIHALLQFHNAAIITLGMSWDVHSHEHNRTELYGTEGTLYVPDPNFFADTLRAGNRDGDIIELPADSHPFSRMNEETDEGELRANYRGAGLASASWARFADSSTCSSAASL